MKIKFIIVFFLISIISFSQNEYKKNIHHHPLIDTNYFFSFEIRPNFNQPYYRYSFSSKTDTLSFVCWIGEKQTLIETKLSKETSDFIIKQGIEASENLKIDIKHKPINQEFDVTFQIAHNFDNKDIFIGDKFYLDKIIDFLKEFNNKIQKNCQFPINSFSFKTYNNTYAGSDTTVSVDMDYDGNREDIKDKNIENKSSNKTTFQIAYYDSILNKIKHKEKITFKSEIVTEFRERILEYINNFEYRNKVFKRTNTDFDRFSVAISVPGLMVITSINSIEKARTDKKVIKLIKFLNSNLERKYQFD